MEFDACTESKDKTVFEKITYEYKKYGFYLPRLIFWNVNSRTNTIPVKQNTLGVFLVSGFSIHILNSILSKQLDPYKALMDILKGKRYQAIEKVLKKFSI